LGPVLRSDGADVGDDGSVVRNPERAASLLASGARGRTVRVLVLAVDDDGKPLRRRARASLENLGGSAGANEHGLCSTYGGTLDAAVRPIPQARMAPSAELRSFVHREPIGVID